MRVHEMLPVTGGCGSARNSCCCCIDIRAVLRCQVLQILCHAKHERQPFLEFGHGSVHDAAVKERCLHKHPIDGDSNSGLTPENTNFRNGFFTRIFKNQLPHKNCEAIR